MQPIHMVMNILGWINLEQLRKVITFALEIPCKFINASELELGGIVT
jgi:hypothetical protein